MHAQHGLSSRKRCKHVVLRFTRVGREYPIPSLSAQVAVRSDVPNRRIALRNGRRESLLLPRVLLRSVLYAWESEHRLPVLQVLATKEVDRGAWVVVDERGMVRHEVAVIAQIVERVRIRHSLHFI